MRHHDALFFIRRLSQNSRGDLKIEIGGVIADERNRGDTFQGTNLPFLIR